MNQQKTDKFSIFKDQSWHLLVNSIIFVICAFQYKKIFLKMSQLFELYDNKTSPHFEAHMKFVNILTVNLLFHLPASDFETIIFIFRMKQSKNFTAVGTT